MHSGWERFLAVALGPVGFLVFYSDYRRGVRLKIKGYWSDRVNNPSGFFVGLAACIAFAILWLLGMCYMFGILHDR
ncbi:MAG: hypothetical protein JWN40_809 [Phycisphaerales bacterium]|nr:hypothetical protein [Phycisphaerales bacterium]